MYLYLITNLVNDKKYIGITNNPKKRWENHKCNNDPSMAIAKAIKKYGVENFTFEVLLSNIPLEEIDHYEQEYIKKYNTHVSQGMGYNVSWGGRYNINNSVHQGAKNGMSCLTDEEAKYIKDHRNIPIYVLYDQFSEKIGYEAFKKVYQDKTYKNIVPTVSEYPYNRDFSSQFATTGKLCYDEVVELRKQYDAHIPWKEAYEQYKEIYSDPMTFWNVYNGNRYKLVMPEVFTEENKKFHSSLRSSGENNGRAKMTWEQVEKIRYEFENGIKTRKEIQKEYSFVTPTSINDILRYKTWKNKVNS